MPIYSIEQWNSVEYKMIKMSANNDFFANLSPENVPVEIQ